MTSLGSRLTRREVLRGIGAGAIGLAVGGTALRPRSTLGAPGSPLVEKGELYRTTLEPSQVSLLKGSDRRDMVLQALKQIEDKVVPAIGEKKILLKPNLVSTQNQLSSTHVDAVRGVLDFLKPHHKQKITIGESSAFGSAMPGYSNFGYAALEEEYDVELIDLNTEAWQYRYAMGRGNRPTPVRIISRFFDPDQYIISVAPMKTHDRVVTTLSLKNVLMAAPVSDSRGSDKQAMHPSNAFTRDTVLHYNMFHLAQEIYPDLGVIDGFQAMEGNGPMSGTPVDAKMVLASTDALALDILATKLMGFDPSKILYLVSMAQACMGQSDYEKIEVLGTPAEECQHKFQIARQLAEAYAEEGSPAEQPQAGGQGPMRRAR